MTTTDWIINIVLIAIVALQIWERRLSVVQLLLPFAIVCWAAFVFVHSVPTQGNSPVAIGFIVLVGTVLGAAIGLLTRVRLRDGKVVARAGLWAAGLWVLGMAARLVFQLWATGGGAETLLRFDIDHRLSNALWPAALVFMAGATVLVRSILLVARGARLRRSVVRSGAAALAE